MTPLDRLTPRRFALVVFIMFLSVVGFWIYQNLLFYSGWFGQPANIQELVDKWTEQENIPGIILRIDKNKNTIFSSATGTVKLGGNDALSLETPFHTASVGKLFTSLTLLKLYEKGVLSLDESIAPYVDKQILAGLLVVDGKDYSQEITFRQLVTHSSGLANTDDSLRFQFWVLSKRDRKRHPSELIDFARKMEPVGKPDEVISYSSVGYFLLGLALEGVTQQPYHELVRRELFEPLKMNSTYESNSELPMGHKTSHHYFGYIDLAENTDPSFEFADGGFVTTAEDMVRLGNAIIQGSIFKSDEINALFNTPLPDGSGFGYFWDQTPSGIKYLFQPGFWGVRLAIFPEQKMVIVFTLNQSNTLTQKFSKQLIQLLSENGHLKSS